MILLVCIGGLGLFLAATQPGLQSELLGLASGLTGALTAMLKLKDAVWSWLPTGKPAAS
jgi:hypothetical protein